MPSKFRVLIFIVSYNAEAFIENVLNRIPDQVWENDNYSTEVLVIDDQSLDGTFDRVAKFIDTYPHRKIQLLYNPVNQGYGGNQKLGYHYAIRRNFDAVVLLHGDGQYAPESLDELISPILRGEADVTLGSRMLNRFEALQGKMPVYKWLGNQILTLFQNRILHTKLSEFHTGYRAYSTESLRRIPFDHNSNYFDFDTDILIQLLDTDQRITEIGIPTYYGTEISYVNGLRYAVRIILTTLRSRIVRLGLLYDRRFDYRENMNGYYRPKIGYLSSHQFALDRASEGMTVLDIGSGPGYMAKELSEKGVQVISVDRSITDLGKQYSMRAISSSDIEDLNFDDIYQQIDMIFLLDIIEHLRDPESFLMKLRARFARTRPPLIITTGNVGFFVVRFGLLLGQFNYGKRGILDLDHKRLFTFSSMKRLLEASGYEILESYAIPAPYPLAIGDNRFARLLLAVNRFLNVLSRGLFAYQMAFVVKPHLMVEHLLENAYEAGNQKMQAREHAVACYPQEK
jgi:glycosyltransferase involved in cell wall biosynthesis